MRYETIWKNQAYFSIKERGLQMSSPFSGQVRTAGLAALRLRDSGMGLGKAVLLASGSFGVNPDDVYRYLATIEQANH